MTKKEKLLKKIEEATLKEEMALPIYTSHISASLFWSGLNEKAKEKIIADLQILHDDSTHHVELLNKVRRMYMTKTKQNV